MNNTITRETIEQMVTMIHQINNLPATDTTSVNALKTALSRLFVDHASEFLGAWIAVETEYEPLVNVIAAINRRATGINAQREQRRNAIVQEANSTEEVSQAPSVTIDAKDNIDRSMIRDAVAKAKNVIIMPPNTLV